MRVTARCETRREIEQKGVPEPAMRLAHIRDKRRRFIGPGGWCYLLANLTQAVSVFLASQSRSCEIYPKSGRTMVRGVAGPCSVAEEVYFL